MPDSREEWKKEQARTIRTDIIRQLRSDDDVPFSALSAIARIVGVRGSPPASGDFSVRDEANALTAISFRNGFLEEMHRGDHLNLSKDPTYFRITDVEMKRLMIQSSAVLERMLLMKMASLEEYEKYIQEFWRQYCQHWERNSENA